MQATTRTLLRHRYPTVNHRLLCITYGCIFNRPACFCASRIRYRVQSDLQTLQSIAYHPMLEDPTFVCLSVPICSCLRWHPIRRAPLLAMLPIETSLAHGHSTIICCTQLCAPHGSKMAIDIWFHTAYTPLLRTASQLCTHRLAMTFLLPLSAKASRAILKVHGLLNNTLLYTSSI